MSFPKPPPLPRPPRLPPDPPASRPLTKLASKKSFPPEPPTTLQFRSSELVQDWASSLPEHKILLERMARHYAALAKRKRQSLGGG